MIRIVPLLSLLLLIACTATITTHPIAPMAQPWLESGKTFRLRHDGVLQLTAKTIPMTGFMVLDTKAKQAKLALLTGLGIKLAILEIGKNEYKVLTSTPVADRIPHFLEQCAFSVQRIFLDDTGAPGNSTWTLHHEGVVEVDGLTLPKKTVFTQHDARYTITLQLNGAEIR